MKRHTMPRSQSKRDFRKKSNVHPKNHLGSGSVMRGGIRL